MVGPMADLEGMGNRHYMQMCASNGILEPAPLVMIVSVGIVVGRVMMQVKRANYIKQPHIPIAAQGQVDSEFSETPSLLSFGGEVSWSPEDFIRAHLAVVSSGKYNFEGCRIPIPTTIRYDRLREALGDEATSKQLRVLELLEFGIPIDCKGNFGVKKPQRNHHSAVSFKKDIEEYLHKNLQCKAILGPFEHPPIQSFAIAP